MMNPYTFISIIFLTLINESLEYVPTSVNCNPSVDVLFAEDSIGRQSFLKCRAYGSADTGYWERHYCPNEMYFEYNTQQCKTQLESPNVVRQENEILHIAILNGSCASGEQCIGGTVCDYAVRRCLCPFGTVVNLETLSCVQPQNPSTSVSNLYPNGPTGSSSTSGSMPTQQLQNTYYGQNSMPYNTRNMGGESSTALSQYYRSLIEQFQRAQQQSKMMPAQTTQLYTTTIPPTTPLPTEPSQNFMNIIVPPGSSCKNGEKCGGGSTCLQVLGLCLCPPEMEIQNSQCIMSAPTPTPPPPSTLPPILDKVPIGGFCHHFSVCDNDSKCLNSRCQCAPPLVENNNRCVPQQQVGPREAKPGERCSNGEVCTRGSICDQQVPVCICPPGTDLLNGYCLQEARFTSQNSGTNSGILTFFVYIFVGSNYELNQQINSNGVQSNALTGNAVYSSVGSNSIVPVKIETAPPPMPQTQTTTMPSLAVNPMKKQQHVKQVGVGARCSLNADCMAGAYCNGNSQPPSCQCLSTHVNVNDKCEKVIYPGQKGCQNDLQCTTAYAGTRCIDTQCICPPGSKAVEQTCVSAFAWPGDHCNSTTPNSIPMCAGNSYCLDFKCHCPPEFVEFEKQCISRINSKNSNNSQSPSNLITAPLTDPCNRNDECPPGFLCLENRCDCAPEKTRFKMSCVSNVWPPLDSTMDNLNTELDAERLKTRKQIVGNKTNSHLTPVPNGIEQIFSTIAMLKKTPTHVSPYAELPSMAQLGSYRGSNADFVGYEHGLVQKSKEFEHEQLVLSKRESWNGKAYGEICGPETNCLFGLKCNNGICGCEPNYKYEKYKCVKRKSSKPKKSFANLAAFRLIGDECSEVDRCSGGSVCRDSFCVCTDGAKQEGDRCKQKPNKRCSYGQTCSGGSECNLGICRCPSGQNAINDSCVTAISKPGESCQSGEMCGNGSVCRFGVCMCQTDFHIVDEHCERVGFHRNPINTDGSLKTKMRNIVIKPADSDSTLLLNDAPEEKKSDKKAKRISTTAPGHLCTRGEACTGGSVCKNGYCVCAADEVIVNDKCVNSNGEALQTFEHLYNSGPGQLCTLETNCTGNSICMANICSCPEGSTLFHGECLTTPKLSDLSASKAHSILFSPEAVDNSLDSGLKDLRPGVMCQISLECPYFAECIREVCRCKKSETIVNGICRRAIYEVPPGGRCDTQKGLDCIGESHCFYGICVCLYGLVNIGHECASSNVLNTTPVGQNCRFGQQCEGGTECVNGVCQCPNGESLDINKRCTINPLSQQQFNPDGGGSYGEMTLPETYRSQRPLAQKTSKFLYGISPDEAGKFSQILTANQMSINVIDQETLKALISGQLMPLPSVGEKCHGMCSKSAKCVRSVCKCTDGLVENSNGGCTFNNGNDVAGSSASYQNGQQQQNNYNAISSQQQQMPYSNMNQQQQQQNNYNSISSQQQMQYSNINQQQQETNNNGLPGNGCAPMSQCYRGSICINGLCVCRPGYKPRNEICQIARVDLGDSCFINEQCKGNGFCIEGICKCQNNLPLGTTFNPIVGPEHTTVCPTRPIAQAGEDCSKSQACGWNSVCGAFSGVCECPSEMETYQGACVVARKPRGIICINSIQCHKSRYCDNGYCICKAGYTLINNYCMPKPKPVIEDPRSYIDPNIIVKNTMSENFNNNGLNTEDNLHMAFGSKFGKHTNVNSYTDTNSILEPLIRPSKMELINFQRLISGLAQPETSITNQQQNTWASLINSQQQQSFGPGMSNYNNNNNNLDIQHFPQNLGSSSNGVPNSSAYGSPTFKLDKDYESKFPAIATTEDFIRRATDEENLQVLAVMPGEHCNATRICLGNSRCISGWCQCIDKMKIENGICALQNFEIPFNVAHKPPIKSDTSMASSFNYMDKKNKVQLRLPYESCANMEHCIEGSVCIKSTNMVEVQRLGPFCKCRPELVYFMRICIPRQTTMRLVKSGESCKNGEICDNGTTCSKDGICKCLGDGRKIIMDICVKESKPGESCQNGEFCAENAVCVTGLSVCVCPIGWQAKDGRCEKEPNLEAAANTLNSLISPKNTHHIMSSLKKTLKPAPNLVALPGQICDEETRCSDESTCSSNGYCACNGGLVEVYNMCVPSTKIRIPGQKCLADEICSRNSWCKDGVCQCISRIPPQNDYCESVKPAQLEIKPLSTPKRHPLSSYGPLRAPTKPIPDNLLQQHVRIFQKKREFKCSKNEECPLGAECISNLCTCNDEVIQKVPSRSNIELDFLHDGRKHGIRCESDDHCPSVLNCLESACVCIRLIDEYTDGNGTRKNDEDEEVPEYEYSYSPALKSSTKPEYEKNSNFSFPSASAIILPGMFCTPETGCGRGAYCSYGMCQCVNKEQHLTFVNGTTSCENLDQFDYETWNLTPKSFQITTKKFLDTYKNESREGKGRIGQPCQYTYECQIDLTCFDGICDCIPNAKNGIECGNRKNRRQINGKFGDFTNMNVLPGASCTSGETCTGGSVCQNGWCHCPSKNMVIYEGNCVNPTSSYSAKVPEYPIKESSLNRMPFASEPMHYYPGNATFDETTTAKFTSISESTPTASGIALPGSQCGPLDTCTGGSGCFDGICLCPPGKKPSSITQHCEIVEYEQTTTTTEASTLSANPKNFRNLMDSTDLEAQHITITNPNFEGSFEIEESVLEAKCQGTDCDIKSMCADSDCLEMANATETLTTNNSIPNNNNSLIISSTSNPTTSINNTLLTQHTTLNNTHLLFTTEAPLKRVTRDWRKANRYARPFESCKDQQVCTGGSTCDLDKRICKCPAHKPIVREHICIATDEKPMIKAKVAFPNEKCDIETRCINHSVCVDGICKCESGFKPINAKCILTATNDTATNTSSTLNTTLKKITKRESMKNAPEQTDTKNLVEKSEKSIHQRTETVRLNRPRIVGPPIRRPKPTAAEDSDETDDSSSSVARGTSGIRLKTGDGAGVCPPGNSPFLLNGKIVTCNGIEPNCPPKTYCYVTVGGVASGLYNCCKSY